MSAYEPPVEVLEAAARVAAPIIVHESWQSLNVYRQVALTAAVAEISRPVSVHMLAVHEAEVESLRAELTRVREQWDAARDANDDAIRLMSDLMLRAPSAGDDADGFILGYILPTGPLHRIGAFLTQHGHSFPQARSWAEVKDELLIKARDAADRGTEDAS